MCYPLAENRSERPLSSVGFTNNLFTLEQVTTSLRASMDVKQALYMNRGEGETSYAHNSKFTQKVNSITKPILVNSVESLFSKGFNLHNLLNVADLGCSAGPNTFSVIRTVKESVERKCRELNCQTVPEIQFYMNDLLGNDFNSLFKGLFRSCDQTQGVSCYAMGVPGSFHSRLFPRNNLQLVHSSYSVHWLSQVPKGLTSSEGLPLNKGKMYISTTSPLVVTEAYLAQFQEDFTAFLKYRYEEMVPDGNVVLILHGRKSADPLDKESCWMWERLAEAFTEMISQGQVEEEKLDSFNVPYYTPCLEEVRDIVAKEGSFVIERLETFAIEFMDQEKKDTKGEKLAKNIRCFTEPLISYHFGEEIMDDFYHKFTRIIVDDATKESMQTTSIIVVLRRILG